eukprot:scaffold6164_cov89-Skeletonema_dohrnii-CCMP3373.AAC.5
MKVSAVQAWQQTMDIAKALRFHIGKPTLEGFMRIEIFDSVARENIRKISTASAENVSALVAKQGTGCCGTGTIKSRFEMGQERMSQQMSQLRSA